MIRYILIIILCVLHTAAWADSCTGTYQRSCYPHWLDLDGDGQDARQEILARDSLIPVTRDAAGKIIAGLWCGPYTGRCTRNPRQMDIDHRLSLGEIHRIGGNTLSSDQRKAIANDPLNLVAVWASANRQKSDRDTFNWMPANIHFWREYIESRELVRAKYGLSFAAGEQDAIEFFLDKANRYRNGVKLDRVRNWFATFFGWEYTL